MKFVIIGAGSGFGGTLSRDVLSRESLRDCSIGLCDIDEKKLNMVHSYVKKVIDGNNLNAQVLSDVNRKKLLKDADFVVISVAIGGPAYYDNPYEFEIGIPKKYGVMQNVGDTVGPAGIFRALRTAPEIIKMLEDINELCPKATILNYTNPMAMLTWVINQKSKAPSVGLCHGVQGTSHELAHFINAPYEEVSFWVAGINHLAWFLKFDHKGEDAYPRLFEAMKKPEIFAREKVRFELMKEFGYFPTESTPHDAEYVPWYQREEEKFEWGKNFIPNARKNKQSWYEDMGVKASQRESIQLIRSHEYASGIMEAMTTGVPMIFNGNVMNKGYITNLIPTCCVEVPCFVDKKGVHPTVVGDLPPQLAALCRLNIAPQELTVNAILNRDRSTAFQAMLLDPSVMATLSIKKAREMFDEMWEAEGKLLAYYG